MTLEILICTINNGINNIPEILLAPTDGISYLVSWQTEDINTEIPSELIRDDVKVITLKGKGLSKNRNNAVSHATGDICLIADDDVRYKTEDLFKIIDIFKGNKTLDLAVFKYGSLSEHKNYPDYSFNLTKLFKNIPRGYYISSIEIAFRKSSVAGKIRFNELFGIGAPVLSSGEESIFLLYALKNKLNCFYFPVEIVTHESTTTGKKPKTPEFIMSQGANAYFWHPYTCYILMVKMALAMFLKNRLNFFHTLRYAIRGIAYAKEIK